MDELVPVILGALFGAAIWLSARGRKRFVSSGLAVVLAAVAATLASGEYMASWAYLLLDLGEAAFGLILGWVIAARVSPARNPSATAQ